MENISSEERFARGYSIRATPVFRDGKWIAENVEWYLPSAEELDLLDQKEADTPNTLPDQSAAPSS